MRRIGGRNGEITRQKESKIRCDADVAHCHKGDIAPPLDKPQAAVFFHAVDEYSNVGVSRNNANNWSRS